MQGENRQLYEVEMLEQLSLVELEVRTEVAEIIKEDCFALNCSEGAEENAASESEKMSTRGRDEEVERTPQQELVEEETIVALRLPEFRFRFWRTRTSKAG